MKTDGSDRNSKATQTDEKEDGTLKQQLFKYIKPLEMALPPGITPERILRIAMTAVQVSRNLAACETRSFLGSLLTAAQLGLEPNTPLGHCYLIPRWDKKANGYKCNFQMGYQGMLELAYRSRLYKRISARVVYKGDVFSFSYGKNHHLDHEPKWTSQDPVYVYADYEIENGGYDFAVWSWAAIMKHAEDFSDSLDSNYSPWKSNAEEMAKKTVLKSLLKYGPRSIEIAAIDMTKALNYDGNVVQANKLVNGTEAVIQYDVQPTDATPMQEKPNDAKQQQSDKPSETPSNKEKAGAETSEALKDSSLFEQEEAGYLEEQYKKSQAGAEPPAFD